MYKALDRFEQLFKNRVYRHRSSTQGNEVAALVLEDLLILGASHKLVRGVNDHELVVGPSGSVKGRAGRRGDVMFGRIVPNTTSTPAPGRSVRNGLVAVAQLGIEVKTLAKRGAMIKQIDRVISDLKNQSHVFRKHPQCLAVAMVGINYSERYRGYEGDRTFFEETTLAAAKRESDEIIRRLDLETRSEFDELVILRFKATNEPPYGFTWLNKVQTEEEYASALARLSAEYDRRF